MLIEEPWSRSLIQMVCLTTCSHGCLCQAGMTGHRLVVEAAVKVPRLNCKYRYHHPCPLVLTASVPTCTLPRKKTWSNRLGQREAEARIVRSPLTPRQSHVIMALHCTRWGYPPRLLRTGKTAPKRQAITPVSRDHYQNRSRLCL